MTTVTRHASLNWLGDRRFSAGASDGPRVTIDGDGVEGPSPVMSLMLAAGACSGADIADILRKCKVELTSFRIEVTAKRPEEYPRPLREVRMVFRLAGSGLTEANVQRAVELSVTKYCSVLLSLNPAIPITTEIVIE